MSPKARLRSEPRKTRETGRVSSAASPKDELRRLQDRGLGGELRRVVWTYDNSAIVEAEVIGDTVFVYARDPEPAVRLVRHEVVHFEIARCQQPYLELLNAVLSTAGKDAQRRSECLADRLTNAIGDDVRT